MTDTAVSRSNPANRPVQRTPTRAQPLAEDVRAMGEAFAKVRGQAQGLAGRAGQQQQVPLTKAPPQPLGQVPADARAELARIAGWRAADQRGTLDRREAERGGEQALGMVSPAHTPVPTAATLPAPSPHADPAAFAQTLADLWTRENGRGDRQVRVRFGNDAWPATGALMVQSADGLLDVTVDMAAGHVLSSTDALVQALGAAGLTVGRVATSEDAAAG